MFFYELDIISSVSNYFIVTHIHSQVHGIIILFIIFVYQHLILTNCGLVFSKILICFNQATTLLNAYHNFIIITIIKFVQLVDIYLISLVHPNNYEIYLLLQFDVYLLISLIMHFLESSQTCF